MSDSMNFDHQNAIFDPRLAQPLTILGAGSVGSHVGVLAASIGCTDITVWDKDDVASHNVPMSEYRKDDVSSFKVLALQEIIQIKTGIVIHPIQQMYSGGKELRTSTIMCVDEMDQRKLIWEHVKNNIFVDIFIDTRVAQEYVEVFAIRPCETQDVAYYKDFLYPTDQAYKPTCGNHGTKYIASTAANIAISALTCWWKSHSVKRHLKMLCGHFQEV